MFLFQDRRFYIVNIIHIININMDRYRLVRRWVSEKMLNV